jgi:hypothetical protein
MFLCLKPQQIVIGKLFLILGFAFLSLYRVYFQSLVPTEEGKGEPPLLLQAFLITRNGIFFASMLAWSTSSEEACIPIRALYGLVTWREQTI